MTYSDQSNNLIYSYRNLDMTVKRTNEEWLSELIVYNERQADAITDLGEVLKHGSRYAFRQGSNRLKDLDSHQIEQFIEDCCQDALLEVLNHISEFRGDSKFTTWAYKFAVNITLTAMHRASWKNISLDQLLEQNNENSKVFMDTSGEDPVRILQRKEILHSIENIIENNLTDKQQQVIKLMVLNEVPMDVVVQSLGTNRNAIYKLLHDARRKLKEQIHSGGFNISEIIDLFSV